MKASLADWIDVFDQMMFDYADKIRMLNAFVWHYVLKGADEKKLEDYLKKLTKNPDFNGDGIPDIAVTGGTSVSVLLGNGDGSFQLFDVSFGVGRFPRFAGVGDFNGDGKPDLAVVGGGITILINNTN